MKTNLPIHRLIFSVALGCLLGASGCATHTGRGAVAGGVGGAAIGAALGSLSGNAGKGAAIGAGIGAVTGGLVGNDIDREKKHEQNMRLAHAEAIANPPLSVEEIATMARSGQSDSVIINQIRASGAIYKLTPDQLNWLKSNGVSDSVLIEMQNTARRPVVMAQPAPRPVYVAQPAPVMVVAPPPPPAPVGLQFSYQHTRIR